MILNYDWIDIWLWYYEWIYVISMVKPSLFDKFYIFGVYARNGEIEELQLIC